MTRTKYLALAAFCTSFVTAATAHARIDGEAIPGRPFGVARITLSAADVGGAIDADRVLISERDGRALYPAVMPGALARVFGKLLGETEGDGVNNVTITFLFHGDDPLTLTVYTPSPTEISLTPRDVAAGAHARLMQRWWR